MVSEGVIVIRAIGHKLTPKDKSQHANELCWPRTFVHTSESAP